MNEIRNNILIYRGLVIGLKGIRKEKESKK